MIWDYSQVFFILWLWLHPWLSWKKRKASASLSMVVVTTWPSFSRFWTLRFVWTGLSCSPSQLFKGSHFYAPWHRIWLLGGKPCTYCTFRWRRSRTSATATWGSTSAAHAFIVLDTLLNRWLYASSAQDFNTSIYFWVSPIRTSYVDSKSFCCRRTACRALSRRYFK